MTAFLASLTGSFSQPAGDNPTVAMVEAAYADLGIDWRYVNCEVAPADLADAVAGARAMGWAGFNCSLPHKVAVIDHLDELTDAARLIGAVNCVFRRGDAWVGDNTDGKGFVGALAAEADLAGASMLVLGAGGAARAIAVESAAVGVAHVTVANRSADRAAQLAGHIASVTDASAAHLDASSPVAVPSGTQVVVNATSVGMSPQQDRLPPIDLATLSPGMVVCDVIPNPPETLLLRRARESGCSTVDGLGMLVNQALVAIEHWTGRRADPAVMRAALESTLGI